jgi:hypothetical protein
MAKSTRTKRSVRRQPGKRSGASRTISRREYAELVLRLSSAELQAQRNRAELDLHAARITELQGILENLMRAADAAAAASELPALPHTPTRTVES